jgi:hypothetical protein
MKTGSSILRRSIGGAIGSLALAVMFLPAAAGGAGTSTTETVTTFGVTSLGNCAGGTQSPIVADVAEELALGFYFPSLDLPTVSLNPGCEAAPSALSSLISASNTGSSSPDGSATFSSEALGNQLLGESASAGVQFTVSIPLSAPASSVDVTIPYTTTGVTLTPLSNNGSYASAIVNVDPNFAANFSDGISCADGSEGTMLPYRETGSLLVFPLGQNVPAGSGTVTGISFYCPDGSDIVSGVSFVVQVLTDVNAVNGTTESASVNFEMHGVTATINS